MMQEEKERAPSENVGSSLALALANENRMNRQEVESAVRSDARLNEEAKKNKKSCEF